MYSTQLSEYNEYDTNNLLLQVSENKYGGSRVRIMTHHLDGTRGDLILSTPRVLTFGLQEQRDVETQRVIGYQLPLILWGKNGPTDNENLFINIINDITDKCQQFIMEKKHLFTSESLDEKNLTRLNPLYYKFEKGEVQTDRAPLLYTRLNIYRHDDDVQIRTLFTDEVTKEPIDPLTLVNKKFFIKGAIRFENVMIGNRPRIHVKLVEARIRMLDQGIKSLLNPDKIYKKQSLYANRETAAQAEV